MKELYEMIFKRKSIRTYKEELKISEGELKKISEITSNLIPLSKDIKVLFKIVKREETTAKRGEYCLLMYSEKKNGYLQNAGYMFEQADLILEKEDIGVCWYGMAKPKEKTINGLDYVIMFSLGKSVSEDFRNGISDFNRKTVETIWEGEFDQSVKEAVRLSPSACNSQPVSIKSENGKIILYRNSKIFTIMPPKTKEYFNTIDTGIAMCILEISLEKINRKFTRTLCLGNENEKGLIKIAGYTVGDM